MKTFKNFQTLRNLLQQNLLQHPKILLNKRNVEILLYYNSYVNEENMFTVV